MNYETEGIMRHFHKTESFQLVINADTLVRTATSM